MICRPAFCFGFAVFLLATGDLGAQKSVVLRMQPKIGDTLYLRIDQEMEMRGRAQDGSDSIRSIGSSLRVRARAIPTGVVGGATLITAITDSLLMVGPSIGGTSPAVPQTLERSRGSLEGYRVQVRVLPDGAMELAEPGEHDDEISPLLGNMPALLPQSAVRPGDQWVREMRLPIRGSRGMPGLVRATFRLDSLARDGRLAYISVRGAFYERRENPAASPREVEGSLTGALEFNRQLGWITDSRTVITIQSYGRAAAPRTPPMAVWTRITQRLQARSAR